MVERRLSSVEEIKEKYRKTGVVVFIFNQQGEILVVEEDLSAAATGKERGEVGVICETSEEEESWEETVIQGLREEIGVMPLKNFYAVDPRGSFLGESLFIEGVLARLVVLYWRRNKDEVWSGIKDGEVSIVGWKRPENLICNSLLRQGVRNVLQDCLKNGAFSGLGNIAENGLLPLTLSNLKKVEEIL